MWRAPPFFIPQEKQDPFELSPACKFELHPLLVRPSLYTTVQQTDAA